VQDVADDRDVKPSRRPKRLAHRVEVEQRLRRMLVLPSPALTMCASVTRATSCGAPICGMADHDHVGVVGARA
jgi:hypothetical protein